MAKVHELMRNSNITGFSYIFEKTLEANEEVIVKMPVPSANKRGINDIGWQSTGDVTLYGTLFPDVGRDDVIWEKIEENNDINKTVSGIKVVCGSVPCRIVIRAILF